MRLKRGKLSFLPLVLALAAGGIAAPAFAGGPYHDRVYADSFGNLVIHSRSGYKRIVVGAGHLAEELAGYEQLEGGDDVVYLDDVTSRPIAGSRPCCSRAAATCTAWKMANCPTCPAAAIRNLGPRLARFCAARNSPDLVTFLRPMRQRGSIYGE